ncbi:MAG: GWxTD domain-containing protein [Bacteroidota bacterium]|nr:GWxTD domain-containing protein [Bacteroidota bacterium]
MKKYFFLLVFLSFVLSNTHAQDKIGFEFDYAQFAYNSDSNFVEFYYSFSQSTLKPVNEKINALMHIVIKDSAGTKDFVNREFRLNQPFVSDSSGASRSLVGIINFVLPKGIYKCSITGKDINLPNNEKTIVELIKINPYISKAFSISNLQLASNIIQESANKNSIFYKNSFEVTPIPMSVFGENQPILFYYYELYGLAGVKQDNVLKLNTFVYNSKNKRVYSKSKIISHKLDTQVQVGSLPVNKFANDTYTLIITLVDSAGNYGCTSSKKFFVYNPSIIEKEETSKEVGNALTSEFGAMSDEELDDIYAKTKYLVGSQDAKKYDKLSTVEAKREFLYKFWKDRDYDPSTPENEAFKEYLQKIETANQKYGSMQKLGWKSDRGRIFLIYGEPSEVERFPNQGDQKPYEIWHYNDLQGGTICVFADLSGFSDYTMIHSTIRGELRDDNYERRLNAM